MDVISRDLLGSDANALVRVADFDGLRGCAAADTITTGDDILFVSHELFLTVELAKTSTLVSLIDEISSLSNDDVLALLLLHERFRLEDSPHRAYIRSLPTEYSNTIHWSENERRKLAGSNLNMLTDILLQQIQTDFTDFIQTICERHVELFGEVGIREYKWALSTIWSRALDLTIDDKIVRCLVPFADMLNHKPGSAVTHFFDNDSKGLRVKALTSFRAGEEVCLDYGPFSNEKLLRLYGFSLVNNPYDSVQLWAVIQPDSVLADYKVSLLQQHGFDNSSPFQLTESCLNRSLLAALRIQHMTPLLFRYADAAFAGPIDTENEQEVLSSLRGGLESMLSQYTSSDDEDAHDLHDPNFHHVCAARLRIGEKRILRFSISAVEREISALDSIASN
eukprot:GILJ01008676.1.p1 GENE.GILJ01008676.1~~GILJ01008676.1.p1  ORF type:complete len:394 (-),score=42.18 GILJ01008676.1:47-1228(-)